MSQPARASLAVIGGSGLYELDGISDIERVNIETPYGAPSDTIVIGTLEGERTAFLPRHGVGHRILPGELPQRANIWALASLGVARILSVSAVGSLKDELAPGAVVVPDQLIDRTNGGRPSTFFGDGIVAHIAFDAPFCPSLSSVLHANAEASVDAHSGGTLIVIEGPAFSTRAESLLYRSWGADIIGMTALPEAKLAREAGICYATLACVTDYDTWHATHGTVTAAMIIRVLRENVANARRVVAATASALPSRDACGCAGALDTAIITSLDAVAPERLEALAPILSRRGEAVAR